MALGDGAWRLCDARPFYCPVVIYVTMCYIVRHYLFVLPKNVYQDCLMPVAVLDF